MGWITRFLIIIGAAVALFFFYFAHDRKKAKKNHAKSQIPTDLVQCPKCKAYAMEKCKQSGCPI